MQFCARLDFAVDDAEGGKGLTVSEASAHGNPFATVSYSLPDQLMFLLAMLCLLLPMCRPMYAMQEALRRRSELTAV